MKRLYDAWGMAGPRSSSRPSERSRVLNSGRPPRVPCVSRALLLRVERNYNVGGSQPLHLCGMSHGTTRNNTGLPDDSSQRGVRAAQSMSRTTVTGHWILSLEHDLPANQGHLTAKVLQRRGRDRVHVAIPYGDIGLLPDFERTDFRFEKQQARRPDRVGPQRGADVDRLRRSERRPAVTAGLGFASDGGPESVARGIRRHAVVGPTAPHHAVLHERRERLEPQVPLRTEVAGIRIADRPEKRRLRFRVARVVRLLQ